MTNMPALLTGAVDTGPEAVLLWEAHGGLAHINPAAGKLLGIAPADSQRRSDLTGHF